MESPTMPRSRVIAIIAIAVLAVAIGGFIAYDQILRGDTTAALTLPSAAPSAATSTTTSTPSAAASSEPSTTTGSAAPAASAGSGSSGDVGGNWSIAAGSLAGYRVREQLAQLPAESDAVGRTDKVTGSMTLTSSDGKTTLTAGTITVDTTSITSDESRRDNRLRSEGLQTDQYPTATFTITQPVEIPAAALTGTASDVTLVGDLELHGVKKSVSIPAQAQLANGTISVAGSVNFPLSDFNITAPNIGGFIVSIEDNGTLEFLVNFTKS
jgi:polyisoprenoid-binding protein YceI